MLNSILPCNWEILISPGNMSAVYSALFSSGAFLVTYLLIGEGEGEEEDLTSTFWKLEFFLH